MLVESFGSIIVPLGKGMSASIRQDGNTKCVALYVPNQLVPADEWTTRSSDITGFWVVFQTTEELIVLLDELVIYSEEKDNEEI